MGNGTDPFMPNRVCQILGIEKPVVQGPMFWLTDAALVAAISNAGGLGSLGPNAGQTTVTRDPIETAERMRVEIKKVKALTTKPFSVNVLPVVGGDDPFTPPMLKVLYEEKVPVVTCAGDLSPSIIKDLKEHGIKIIYRALNPSPENAKEAEKLGVDVIVATGFDEGGTLPSQCIGTFSIVPLIVDAVEHTPVLAAGGIADSRGFNAAFALGAEGVYCGTLFLMSQECRMAQNVKDACLPITAKDLHLFRTLPYYYRSIPCTLADELSKMDKELSPNEEIAKRMGGLANMRVGMLEGDLSKGYVSVGNGIGLIHDIRPVADIIKDLTKDFKP